jgi:hypothetical protein
MEQNNQHRNEEFDELVHVEPPLDVRRKPWCSNDLWYHSTAIGMPKINCVANLLISEKIFGLAVPLICQREHNCMDFPTAKISPGCLKKTLNRKNSKLCLCMKSHTAGERITAGLCSFECRKCAVSLSDDRRQDRGRSFWLFVIKASLLVPFCVHDVLIFVQWSFKRRARELFSHSFL